MPHTPYSGDWSSDVFSSDLIVSGPAPPLISRFPPLPEDVTTTESLPAAGVADVIVKFVLSAVVVTTIVSLPVQIGRAPCRERPQVPGADVARRKDDAYDERS